MTATSPLSIALSGLKAAQAQINVASRNIANVSTDGYTRKTLQQTSQILGTEGAGVHTGIVQRNVNDILVRDYRRQISVTTGLETTAGYLDKVQQLHGPPDSEQSISAYLGKLKDTFAALSDTPESTYALTATYTQATQVANKFHELADGLTEMRNDAQTEMKQSVDKINSLTEQISQLNKGIKAALLQGRDTADLADQRDLAVRDLSKEVDLTFFTTTDGVLSVMTRNGQLLADISSVPVYFNSSPLGENNYYPATAAAIRLGDPVNGTDLTTEDTLGGRLGALRTLRDDTIPTYTAQLDELAHKTATRFSAEGLDLFTMPDGTIPANIPASYVGFASNIAVNPAIADDITLLRKGTDPASTVQDGSPEVLRRIVEYTFGNTAYEQGTGTANISNPVPTLFTTLSLTGQARVTGTTNIQSLTHLDDSSFINPGTEDTFTLQVGVAPAQTITITAGMTAAGLVSAINTAIPGTAQLSSGGNLILTANNTLTIGAGTLGAPGLGELGLTAGVTAADPPSFQVGAGNNDLTTVTITSTDTPVELLAKLNAVPGITASIVSNVLKIVPADGGDITLVDGLKSPLAALGVTITNVAHTAFNTTNVGPGANLNTGIQGSVTLMDYSTQAVSSQSQDAAAATSELTTESNYKSTLEKQVLDSTGVNLDEEMAQLISIQTAYSASARTISVVQQMMNDLINAVL